MRKSRIFCAPNAFEIAVLSVPDLVHEGVAVVV